MRKVVLVLLAAAIAVPVVAAPPYEPYPGTKRSSGSASSSSSSSSASQPPATTYGSGVKTYGIGGSDAEFDYKPAASTSAASSGVPSSNWDTYSQMQQMQQEIQTLRGTVEQLSNELELMRKQARERYLDLDTRINQLRGGSAAAVPVAAGGEAAESVAPASASADDKTLYDQASDLRRQQKFDESIAVMEDLLKRSPDGMYAPYCEYWLGEMYMVVKPVQLDKAKAHFITLIGNHGDHVKVPDAMYKLGKLFASQGEKAKAKATLNELVKKHPDKPAANLAKDLLKTL
jgi:tol-pal system protein YbgF